MPGRRGRGWGPGGKPQGPAFRGKWDGNSKNKPRKERPDTKRTEDED